MRGTVGVLVASVLLVLGTAAAAAESAQTTHNVPKTGASDKDTQVDPAECPIKKTIDGKLYCFQNDPALTKRQGGGD